MSPLYRRLLGWFLAANLAVLLVSVFVTDRIGRHVALQEPDWDALAAETLAAYEDGGLIGLAAYAEQMRRIRHIEVTLFHGDDNLLRRRGPPPVRPFLRQLLEADRLVLQPAPQLWLASRALTSVDGERLHFIAMRGPPPPGARRGLLLAVQIALSVLAIAALGFLLARSLTQPIRAVQAATRRMAEGDLSARANAATAARTDELGALARDFNHMAARTETLVNQQRAVLQDVSHELRSPLARLHLLLELARSGGTTESHRQLDRAAAEVGRLDALIGEVLNLSRLESALPGLTPVPVPLDALLHSVAEEHTLEAETRQQRIEVRAVAAMVSGDPALLSRALGNLLGNAIKFGHDGDVVTLGARCDDGEAVITVRDSGPGVPDEDLGRLFQPFYRGRNAAKAEGHGLGLAIAQRIAAAHDGRLAAEQVAGGGLQVTLRLPLAS
jgi:signal transduction histidine kinase